MDERNSRSLGETLWWMRKTLAVVGAGLLILILGAWFAFDRSANNVSATNDSINSATSSRHVMTNSLTVSSSAFQEGTSLPSKYTCDVTAAISPPLSFGNVPTTTKSLALIMHDPDVPKSLKPDGNFDHWVLFNISPTTTQIPEGTSPGTLGANGAGKSAYYNPCPPAQPEPSEHRYFFTLYALDTLLPLKEGASRADVEKAMEGRIIEQAQLIGKYKRK